MPVLEGDETEKLVRTLVDAFPTFDDLEIAVRFCLNENLNTIVGNGHGTAIVALRLVEWAESNERLTDLLNGFPEQSGNRTLSTLCPLLLSSIVKRQPALAFNPKSPYEANVIRMTDLFVNRKSLRQFLRQMDQPTGFRVLTVNGDRGTGKSHSRFLIFHVAGCRGDARRSSIELKRSESKCIKLDDLFRSLMLQLGLAVPDSFDRMSKNERWALELAELLSGAVRVPTWIVLDGFDHAVVPTNTMEFVHHLTRLALDHAFLRVVLLHYRRDRLPADIQRRVREDNIPPVSEVDVQDFLTKVYKQHGCDPQDGTPDKCTREIWSTVGRLQGQPEFMAALADAIFEHLRNLFPGEL